MKPTVGVMACRTAWSSRSGALAAPARGASWLSAGVGCENAGWGWRGAQIFREHEHCSAFLL
eukprot:scaffold15687_cov101-Isochrysis_galbana.AAC.2